MTISITLTEWIGIIGAGLAAWSLWQNHQTRKELRYQGPIERVKAEVMGIFELSTNAATYTGDKSKDFYLQASVKYTNLFALCNDNLNYKSLVGQDKLQSKLTDFFQYCVSDDLTKKSRAECEGDGSLQRMEDSRYSLIAAIDETAFALWRYKARA